MASEDTLLNIQQEQVGKVVVLTLKGPIDSTTYDQFRTALTTVCAGNSRVLLDCRDLTYMNSKSLGQLASSHRLLVKDMGKLALSGLNRKIVKTMDLLGLGQMLKTYETREQALAVLE